ncbi:hypothetical protein I4U23_021651 [Adineta vaga]|nr:hypothetical protein I4U23_021651 [Adineta vaga]
MCCVTLQKRSLNDLFYVPRPSFVIPIFRAPTTTPSIATTTTTTITITGKKIFSTILRPEYKQSDLTSTSTSSSSIMISQRIFENLVLTNTIVAAFCIVLMVTITGFLIFLLIPSIRRRWLNETSRNERKFDDLPALSRQPSLHHFTLGPSRFNPIFEPTAGTTTTTTQFGTLFQPHTTTATLLHPTIWTSMAPASVVSTPVPTQQPQIASTPPASIRTKSSPAATTSTTTAIASTAPAAARPPLPAHPPTTVQRPNHNRKNINPIQR